MKVDFQREAGALTASAEQHAALGAVLSSDCFSKSPNLSRLLQYLCTKYFQGRSHDLKEYNIGVEALGRPLDFDPTTNSSVRVDLHRLRDKLRRYYETEGMADPVVIVLRPGSYVPEFIRREAFDPALAGSEPASPATGSRINGSGDGTDAAVVAEEPAGALPASPAAPVRSLSAPTRRQWKWTVLAAAASMLLGVGLFARWRWRIRESSPAPRPAVTNAAVPPAAMPALPEVRVLCGYSRENYIDREGKVWGPDRYYQGGGATSQAQVFITRTADPVLFQQARLGEFSYNIPLPPGTYELHLYFAETLYGPGTLSGGGETTRVFNVLANGVPLLCNFDPISDAGGNFVADERVFTDVHPAADGHLHLQFVKLNDYPVLNAFEVIPGIPGKMRPIRILAQDNSYTDHAGHLWRPDRYAAGGRLVNHRRLVEGSADPDLYASERFGNFSYAIPVAPGTYKATLHFAETYFGPSNAGKGGPGSRIFDVSCNGVALLQHFDIFKEAGGENRALTRTFHHLRPNAQGKLVFSFVPVRNYAKVNAIEVESE
jgi:hypothetical protein